jgi:hypothetical protein
MSGIYSVTVSGDSYDELVKNFTAMWREMIDADEDDAPVKPAKKAAAVKAAPVPVDDEDEDDDDLDDEDDDLDDDDDDEDDLVDYTEADLKAKGIADLRSIAEEEFEIDTEGLKKAQLIEAILEAQEEDSDDDDEDDDDLDDDEDDEDDEDDDEDEDGYTINELNEMELDELKSIAKEEGITVTPKARKATLVKAIFEVAGVEEDDD